MGRRRKTETPKAENANPEVVRIGKDEMNVIEHPFASLSKEMDTRVIELTWEGEHPVSGAKVQASWRVEGSRTLGLPTANDERVYLMLMEMTRETGWQQTVTFTRHDFVKRLGWTHNQESYRRLEEALARLNGVSITTENAFWSPQSKTFYNGGFHVIEQYMIAAEAPGRKSREAPKEAKSFFKWNDVMFQSFRDGNIRTLDLDFALSLQRPLSLRLFRYLDKKGHGGRTTFQIGLRDLCELHLGMVVDGRYESDLRAGLKPAHAELIERGFLSRAAFEPMKTRKGLKVCYNLSPQKALPAPRNELPDNPNGVPLEGSQISSPVGTLSLFAPPADVPPADAAPMGMPVAEPDAERIAKSSAKTGNSGDGEAVLLAQILAVGVSPDVAKELLRTADHHHLHLQLDSLSDRDAKNPAAVFIKSVRELWALPPAYVARVEAVEAAERAQKALDDSEHAKAHERALKRQQMALADEEAAQLDARYEQLDERNRKRIDDEATKRLGIVAHLGKNEGAMRAMRRTVIRELMASMNSMA